MLTNILKAFVPSKLIIPVRKMRSSYSPNILFDGDDSLFKDELSKVGVYGEYGCGKSTKWVLDNTSSKVISVDTSRMD